MEQPEAFAGADTIMRWRGWPRDVLYDGAKQHASIMQLTRDAAAVHFIRAWEPGRVRIADRWVAGNVIVASDRVIEGWTTIEPQRLTIVELEPALALEPTILVLGTGSEQLLPDVELMAAVAARSVGLEIMSTRAACRTCNVLLQEQRRVVAALFNP